VKNNRVWMRSNLRPWSWWMYLPAQSDDDFLDPARVSAPIDAGGARLNGVYAAAGGDSNAPARVRGRPTS